MTNETSTSPNHLEIIGELLEVILGFIFEIFREALLQIVFEFLAESGLWSIPSEKTFDGKTGRFLSFIGCALFDVAACAISYVVFPRNLIHKASFLSTNVILTPLVAGAMLAWLGSWHNKHGRRVIALDKFFNATGFALAFAIVRFKWCS
jgi:hypothetical protein